MTKEWKRQMRGSLINFFNLYDDFKNGVCNFERNDKEFKMALLEAHNVILMAIIDDKQELVG